MGNSFQEIRVGLSGSGFIARGLCGVLWNAPGLSLTAILSRRPNPALPTGAEAAKLTSSISEFVDLCDVVVECSGDPLWAAELVDAAFQAGRPVITMNAEFQVVAGTYFAERGLLSEAEGDQPGCIAALARDVRGMGFSPVVFGSQKGFINLKPERAEMERWAKRFGQSVDKIFSFTDGSKVQIESVLVANGLGAGLLAPGLCGPAHATTRAGAVELSYRALAETGSPVVDYVLNENGQGEVFVAATHDGSHTAALSYLKLGDGPFYYFERPFHLSYLEIPKSIIAVVRDGVPLLNNGSDPGYSVAAVAKRKLQKGEFLARCLGTELARGTAVNIRDEPDHVPIGLLQNVVVEDTIEEGELLTSRNVAVPDSLAAKAWEFTRSKVLSPRLLRADARAGASSRGAERSRS
ncbi:MAG: NAD(P)-dependent oxidoreductase [Pseudomonadota bacterium]